MLSKWAPDCPAGFFQLWMIFLPFKEELETCSRQLRRWGKASSQVREVFTLFLTGTTCLHPLGLSRSTQGSRRAWLQAGESRPR